MGAEPPPPRVAARASALAGSRPAAHSSLRTSIETGLGAGLGTALLAGLVAVPAWLTRHSEFDDALIYLRYVRNLRDHGQLVYNLGERFNGLTSPLFTVLSIAVSRFARDPAAMVAAINLVSAALLLGALLVLRRGLSREAGPFAGFLAALLVAVHPFFPACAGMETSLFLLLLAAAALAHLAGRPTATSVLLGLLLVTRSEGLFLVAAIAADAWLRRGASGATRYRSRHLVPLLGPLAAVAAFNRFYYGQGLPHTALAKLGQGLSGYWGKWPRAFLDVGYQRPWLWSGRRSLVLAAAALALLGARSLRGSRWSQVVLPFLAAYLATFVLLNAPHYHWYYAPFYFFGLAYAGAGAAWLLHSALAVPERDRRSLALAAIATLLLAVALPLWLAAGRVTPDQVAPRRYRLVCDWMSRNARPGASVAAAEIGTLGWCGDRPIVDILGLVTPGNAEAVARRDLASWLERGRPDFIVVHERAWAFESVAEDAERRGEYGPVTGFHSPGLRLLCRR